MASGQDRLVRVVATATVWLWAASLCSAWGRIFGVISPVLWTAMAAALTAFAIGLAVPSQFFRAAGALLRILYRRARPSMPPVGSDASRIPLHASRLLGASLIIAAAGSLISAMALLAAAKGVGRFASGFFLGPIALCAVQFVTLTIAMLGWGVGAALVYQAHLVVVGRADDEESPRHQPADWLGGVAVATAVTALTWQNGGDPILLGLASGSIQLGCGLLLIRHRQTGRAVAATSPLSMSRPPVSRRLGLLVRAAVVMGVLSAQMRMMADLLGAALSAQILFAGGSALLLAIFHSHWVGRRFVRPGKASAGAAVLAAAALTTQLTLALVASNAGSRGAWLLWLALGAQIPLAAAAVLLVMTQQKRFVAAGGTPRHWMQWVLTGLALGCLAGALGLGAVDGRPPAMLALLACLAAAVVGGIAVSRSAGKQIVWAAAGGSLLLAATVGLAAAATRIRHAQGRTMVAGAWLTVWGQDGACGYMPVRSRRPDWTLDQRAGQILASIAADGVVPNGVLISGTANHAAEAVLLPGPRWLIAAWRPIVAETAPNLIIDIVVADPAIAAAPVWAGSHVGDLFGALRSRLPAYHGVLYAPLPADHPAARAVYNRHMLSRVTSTLASDGILMVHAACRGPNAAAALAVARTVDEMMGASVAAVRVSGGDVEILIVACKSDSLHWIAPVTQVLRNGLAGQAIVVSGSDLATVGEAVPLIDNTFGTECGGGAFVAARRLEAYLQSAAGQ